MSLYYESPQVFKLASLQVVCSPADVFERKMLQSKGIFYSSAFAFYLLLATCHLLLFFRLSTFDLQTFFDIFINSV